MWAQREEKDNRGLVRRQHIAVIGLSCQDVVPSKIGKNWEDVATDCFKILLWHLRGGTEECSEHQDNIIPLHISVSHILNTNQTTLLLCCAQKSLCF